MNLFTVYGWTSSQSMREGVGYITFYFIGWIGTPNINLMENITWKHFPHYWPFVRGIDRSPVNSPHQGQWRGALMFSLICAWINSWVNNRYAVDLRRHSAHYDVTVMIILEKIDCVISAPHYILILPFVTRSYIWPVSKQFFLFSVNWY